MGAILTLAGLLVLATGAEAQTGTNSSTGSNNASSRMWGSSGAGGAGIGDSSTMHAQDGSAAGQVNAARQGYLFNGGPGMTINAIGSQSIVSTTVIGNNNSTSVNATQTSTNSGSVSNTGTVTLNPQ
jgi:hypothetical protein